MIHSPIIGMFRKNQCASCFGNSGSRGFVVKTFANQARNLARTPIPNEVNAFHKPGASVGTSDSFDRIRTRPIVGAEFSRQLREPFGASIIKFTTGLTDPSNFKFARSIRPFEKAAADGMWQQESSWMTCSREPSFVIGMKNGNLIEESRPPDAALGKRIRIWMEAHSGNFRAFKANRKERMRGFEMEDRRWGIRAGSQHINERRVERNRIADAEKLNSTGSKRFGRTM